MPNGTKALDIPKTKIVESPLNLDTVKFFSYPINNTTIGGFLWHWNDNLIIIKTYGTP